MKAIAVRLNLKEAEESITAAARRFVKNNMSVHNGPQDF